MSMEITEWSCDTNIVSHLSIVCLEATRLVDLAHIF